MNFDGQYLTFAEYQSLGGTLNEVPFNILELTARGMIDERTLGRLQNLPSQINAVKVCVYELIGKMSTSAFEKDKASESIDGYSVSYATNTSQEQIKAYDDIIRSNLLMCRLEDGTPYLYCGVD